LREWKNFLAAQLPQRTYLLSRGRSHFDIFSHFRFSEAESGAKVSTLSQSSKSFVKNLKTFSERTFIGSLRFYAKAVAKVRLIFVISKSFRKKIENIFKNPISLRNHSFTREIGCKVTALI
jgi:hypothetical protein